MTRLHDLAGRTIVVLGLGVTGRTTARVLVERGAEVFASDAGTVDAEILGELEALGVEVEAGSHDRATGRLADAAFVVASPGVAPFSPVLVEAVRRGVLVLSEIELASRMASAPLIAVTGTNGKTTVSRMIGAILTAARKRAVVCGNIGDPFIGAVRSDAEVFVVEVSSFQLAFCDTFHPRVAVITNLAPDHLDWHGSMEAYRDAKARIAAHQHGDDTFVHPAQQPDLGTLAPSPGPRRVAFGFEAPEEGDGVWLDDGVLMARIDGVVDRSVGSIAALEARGRPMVEDGLAAGAAALVYGVAPETVARALEAFVPDAHRVEPVGEVDGVRFYNDSKATNPHATLTAIRGFQSAVLIAGGRNKGLDLGVLRSEAGRLRAVVALGEAAGEVEEAFHGADVPVKQVGSMEQAVEVAAAFAHPGDAVLLSPACASFDLYANYAERGEAFRRAVHRRVSRKAR